jgi:hypothetical protein
MFSYQTIGQNGAAFKSLHGILDKRIQFIFFGKRFKGLKVKLIPKGFYFKIFLYGNK